MFQFPLTLKFFSALSLVIAVAGVYQTPASANYDAPTSFNADYSSATPPLALEVRDLDDDSVIKLAQGQQGKTLQGGVNMNQNYTVPSGPSLNRKFIDQQGDPFSQEGPPPSEQFDAPDASFDNGQQVPPPPAFNLNADQGQFSNAQQQPNMAQQQMLTPMQQGSANDPDNAPHMQIQWEMWHRRVAEAIFVRFDGVAQRAFAQSRPIACQAAYTVTRDRQIVNVRLLHKSNNIVFNSMLLMVLKSMNGNPILEYPPGSRRNSVEKTGTFSRNCGVQGFKFTTGDAETIPNK